MKKPLFNVLPGKVWLAAALAFAAVVLLGSPGARECSVFAASDTNQSEYCFRLDLTITNEAGGVGDLTNYPILFTVPSQAMINNGQMDARHWDIKPTQGGFGAEVNLLAQDCACDSSKWWLIVQSLPDGQSRTFRVYIGNGEQKRNQGIYFSGDELLRVAYDAAMDITDNLGVEVEMELTDATPRNEVIFDHHTPGIGYRLELWNDSSTLKLLASVDGGSCSIAWDSNWTNNNVDFEMRYVSAAGNDLFIDANGVNVAACDTDEGAIGTAGYNFDIGQGPAGTLKLDTAIIRRVILKNNGVIAAGYGFNSLAVDQSTGVDPTYTGTIQDQGVNNLDLTYTFTRSQSGLTPTVGALSLTSESSGAAFSSSLVEIMGGTFLIDPFANTNENTNALGYELFDDAFDSIGAPRPMLWAMFLGSVGLFLAVLVFWFMRNVPMALFAAAMPLTWGTLNGYLPAWWLVLWVLLFVTAYGAQQWGEQS